MRSHGHMRALSVGHDQSINPYLEYYGLPVTGDGTVTPAPAAPPPAASVTPAPTERGK